jgi:protein SCO1/2
MNKKYALVWGIAIIATVALITILQLLQPYKFHGALIENPLPAPEIELPASTGGTFRLSDQAGQIVLIFFGYTSCPDVCPTTLGDLKQVRRQLGDSSDQVQVVFVTVDPERDTEEKLAAYLSLFEQGDIGLTGTIEQLEPVWQAYGVYRAIDTTSQTEAGYLVDHSSRVYLVDQQGNLRLTYAFGTPPEDIAADVEYLINQ